MSRALTRSHKAEFFGDKGFSCLQIRFVQRLFSAQPSFCSPEYSVVSTVHCEAAADRQTDGQTDTQTDSWTDGRMEGLKNLTFYITFKFKSRLSEVATFTFILLDRPTVSFIVLVFFVFRERRN